MPDPAGSSARAGEDVPHPGPRARPEGREQTGEGDGRAAAQTPDRGDGQGRAETPRQEGDRGRGETPGQAGDGKLRAGGVAEAGGVAGALERARGGDARALARLVSLVENGGDGLRPLMTALAPLTGQARVIGLTGAPGVGKSTVTGALVATYRQRGARVAVLAVDPTSPFTGGALLGDRVRMQDHATDADVFIRSMASRGHLGGLSAAAPQALRLLDAVGFGVLLVETVGVGQAEVEIASLADSTLVIAAPGMGDAIQAAKAGILEIGDVFVVNKQDKAGAQETVRDLRTMIAMANRAEGDWKPPIVTTTAVKGEGIEDLAAKLDSHWGWLDSSGEGEARRRVRAREEITAIVVGELRKRVGGLPGDDRLDVLAGQVAEGRVDPFTAADELLAMASGQG